MKYYEHAHKLKNAKLNTLYKINPGYNNKCNNKNANEHETVITNSDKIYVYLVHFLKSLQQDYVPHCTRWNFNMCCFLFCLWANVFPQSGHFRCSLLPWIAFRWKLNAWCELNNFLQRVHACLLWIRHTCIAHMLASNRGMPGQRLQSKRPLLKVKGWVRCLLSCKASWYCCCGTDSYLMNALQSASPTCDMLVRMKCPHPVTRYNKPKFSNWKYISDS